MLVGLGVASPAFLILILVVGQIRPRYDMIADEISELGLGATATIADGGFVVFGTLLCLFAIGLAHSFRADRAGRRGARLLGVAGAAVIGLALFPTDASVRRTTVHGVLHDLAFVVLVGAFSSACWSLSRAFIRDPLWRRAARYTRWTTLGIPLSWAVWAGLADREPYDRRPPLLPWAGLIERTVVVLMIGWIAMVALHHTRLVARTRRARIGVHG